ncbi:UMP-CMP kinase 3 [Orobanche minor]
MKIWKLSDIPFSFSESRIQRYPSIWDTLSLEASERVREETMVNAFLFCKEANGSSDSNKKFKVVFVLGGPGSGKGTQCENIVKHFGYTHLSAGDLLRAERDSGSENGTMIKNMIKEGRIVPSEVTIKLLQRAMEHSGNDKFLIDGFPRNEENRAAFECQMTDGSKCKQNQPQWVLLVILEASCFFVITTSFRETGIEPEFVLFFDCSEEEMEKRLLNRNQGRDDDNIETIKKRFKVYMESSFPVIEYYDSKGKVRKIDAAKPIEEVFESVKEVFTSPSDKRLQTSQVIRELELELMNTSLVALDNTARVELELGFFSLFSSWSSSE